MKFHATKEWKPTRDFNADDVLFSFERQYDEKNPYNKVSGGKFDYYSDMDMPKLVKSWAKDGRLHDRAHAERAERRRSWPISPWISAPSNRPNMPTS